RRIPASQHRVVRSPRAGVLKLEDRPGLGPGARKSVGVRIPPPASPRDRESSKPPQMMRKESSRAAAEDSRLARDGGHDRPSWLRALATEQGEGPSQDHEGHRLLRAARLGGARDTIHDWRLVHACWD